MIVVLNITIIIGLTLFGYWYSKKSELIVFYWPGIGVKIVCGIGLGLLYSYYYSLGDTWTMFNQAIKLKEAMLVSKDGFVDIFFRNDYSSIPDYLYVIQPRSAFMTKILAILVLITGGNYWLCGCYLSLFSFTAFWFLSNTIFKILQNKWAAVLPTLFFPSIVFWSSGVIKESVAIGALVLVISLLTKVFLKKKIRWYGVLVLVTCVLLIIYLKYYYAAMLLVTFLALFSTRIISSKHDRIYVEFIKLFAVFIAILTITSFSHPNFWPSRFLSVITDNYYLYIQNSSPDSVVIFENLVPTITSFIFYSPKALIAGLFYPLWVPSFNWLRLASVLENWFVLSLVIYALANFKIPARKDFRLLLWSLLLFIIFSAVFITFSTPNLGTLVRYRIGYMVVFISLISIAIRIKPEQLNITGPLSLYKKYG